MTKGNWHVTTFAEDMWRTTQDPPPELGDGRKYIVRDVHGQYIQALRAGSGAGSVWLTSARKNAKVFHDGQAAWGAAIKSIYPAEVLVVGRTKKTKT